MRGRLLLRSERRFEARERLHVRGLRRGVLPRRRDRRLRGVSRRNVPAPGQEHGRRELVHRVLGGHGRARAGLGAVLLRGLRSRRSEVREVRRGRRGLQAHRHEVRYAGDAHGGDARDREGLLPLQPRGDGRLPVPGEGRRLRGVGPLETRRLRGRVLRRPLLPRQRRRAALPTLQEGLLPLKGRQIRVQKLRQSRTTRAPARRDRRPHRRVVRRAVRRQGPADALPPRLVRSRGDPVRVLLRDDEPLCWDSPDHAAGPALQVHVGARFHFPGPHVHPKCPEVRLQGHVL